MAYVKIIFQNSPSTATPINAQNLNHMDDQIALNDQRLTELETAGVVNTFNGRTGNVVPQKGDYDVSQIGATDGQNGYVPVWRNSGTEESPDWGFNMEPQSGSGTGGHTIVDQDGTDMASEDDLQFADSFVSDDSVNGRTVVENIKEHTTKADYDNATEDGFHVIDDGNDVPIGDIEEDSVSVTADGVKTLATLLNELYALIDMNKVTDNAFIPYADSFFKLEVKTSNNLFLTRSFSVANTIYYGTMQVGSTNSIFHTWELKESGNTYTNHSTDVPTNGTKLTLYYGTSSTVINLKTSADYCQYDENTTVKQKIETHVLTLTLPSTADTWSTAQALPSGWSANDTFVISAKIQANPNVWIGVNHDDKNALSILIESTGVSVATHDSYAYGKTVKVVVQRFT